MFGFSHSSHSDFGSITGMRSCTGLIVPFADVVTTVAEWSHVLVVGRPPRPGPSTPTTARRPRAARRSGSG